MCVKKRNYACTKRINWARWRTAAALISVLVLSAMAFFLPQSQLGWLVAINSALIIAGLIKRASIWGIVRFVLLQLFFTLGLYLLIYGGENLGQGFFAVVRILLALIPGWWLSVTIMPERIGEVLTFIMPPKWAFVMTASVELLPFMLQELQEIYQLQRLRGAKIAPKQLMNPKNWSELAYCVLFPLLIQLLKLSKQMALAAKGRHFGATPKPTHWQAPQDDHDRK